MEIDPILQQIEKQFPGSVLEVKPMGHGKFLSIWVESKQIVSIAQFLKEHPEGRFNFLENLYAIDLNGTLMLSYFLSSSSHKKTIVLRISLPIIKKEAEVNVLSVQIVWLSAVAYEDEIHHLFGIQFDGKLEAARGFLPHAWSGFPLRKDYVFPAEFLDIPHSRISSRDLSEGDVINDF